MSHLLKLTAQELESISVVARDKMKNAPDKVLGWYRKIRLAGITGDIAPTMHDLVTNTSTLNVGDIDWMYTMWKEVLADVSHSADPSSAADIVATGICLDINDLLNIDGECKQPE